MTNPIDHASSSRTPLLVRAVLVTLALGAFALPLPSSAGDVSAKAEDVVRRSFSTASPAEWSARLAQDEVNALCSKHRNNPPPEVAARIIELSQASIRLPEDGKLMGDWREGEKLAAIGTGGHIGRIQPDRPSTRQGGNCYACHAIAKKEIAAGNMGPSLTHYAKVRGTSPEAVRYVYSKIYNAHAFFPCSSMPRFGHNGWLTPKEIADAVAFLLDPESPANQ